MSDTPRTDAEFNRDESWTATGMRMLRLSRRLERDLAAAREQIAALRGTERCKECPARYDAAEAEVERLREENAALRKDAERYRFLREHCNDGYQGETVWEWIPRKWLRIGGFDAAVDELMRVAASESEVQP